MVQTSIISHLASANPALSACLRETADFLAAPVKPRLTEEQRAMTLGIARRLVFDAVALMDYDIDAAALWADWSSRGMPGAERLSAICFARAEEHRWRTAQGYVGSDSTAPLLDDSGDAAAAPRPEGGELDHGYLALQIADRRRFDASGYPRVAMDDLRPEALHGLLLDIAGWRLAGAEDQTGEAARLGEAVRTALGRHAPDQGIDRTSRDFHAVVQSGGALNAYAEAAIGRHDWLALIALAAAQHQYRFPEMALAIVSAEPAQLAPLLVSLVRDRASLAPLEGSLAALTHRATVGSTLGEGGL